MLRRDWPCLLFLCVSPIAGEVISNVNVEHSNVQRSTLMHDDLVSRKLRGKFECFKASSCRLVAVASSYFTRLIVLAYAQSNRAKSHSINHGEMVRPRSICFFHQLCSMGFKGFEHPAKMLGHTHRYGSTPSCQFCGYPVCPFRIKV